MSNKSQLPRLIEASGLLLLSIVLAIWYGFQYVIPASSIVTYFRIGSGLFVAGILVVLITRLRYNDARPTELPPWFGLIMSALMLGITCFLYSKEISSAFSLPSYAYWLLLTAPVGIALLAHGPASASLIQIILGLLGLAALTLTQPIDVVAANMLPIIQAACDVLAHGENPYATTYPDVATLHFYYLPASFVPYCGLQELGIDLRWLNLLGYAIVAACLAFALPRVRRLHSFTAVALPLLLSPMILQMLIHGHVWVYWTVFAAAYLALINARATLAAALLAVAVGTRQLAALLVIPLGGYLLAGSHRAIFKRILFGTAILCVLMLPAWLAVSDFLHYFYTSIATESAARNVHGINPYDQISIAGLLPLGTPKWALQAMQVAVLLAGMLTVLLLVKRQRLSLALSIAGICMILAAGLNPFLNRYFYMEGLLLLSMTFGWNAKQETSFPKKHDN